MKKTFFILAAFLLLASAFHAAAQIPRTLSYQGVLTDNAGKPRPDGNYTFMFRFYTSPTSGTAIWSESKSLSLKSGLFSTALGEQTPFGAAVKFDQQYWLGIQVGSEPELSPRIALTSVGYSFSSLRADTASVSVASLADTTWRYSGTNIYRLDGNVGIGTSQPRSPLTVSGSTNSSALIELTNTASPNGRRFGVGSAIEGLLQIADLTAGGQTRLVVDANGNVGIGTTNPQERLQVHGNVRLPSGNNLQLWTSQGAGGVHWDNNVNAGFLLYQDGTSNDQGKVLWLEGFGAGNIFAVSNRIKMGIGTSNPQSEFDVNGTTTTKVLAITGGMDLAEPFEISESQPILKGAVVIIDEENPGRLKLSHRAYDKRVAGVVSGAGGINPGLTLTQEGVLEGGQNIALSGRAYALATAANGPIKP